MMVLWSSSAAQDDEARGSGRPAADPEAVRLFLNAAAGTVQDRLALLYEAGEVAGPGEMASQEILRRQRQRTHSSASCG